MSGWSFRPPWWAWLSTLLLCALMINLALWQYHRGQAKEVLMQRYVEADAAQPRDFDPAEAPRAMEMLKRQASGTYLADRQLLLDNQSSQRRPGYHVWTPLQLADGSLLLVSRGWVPANPDRRQLPVVDVPAGPQDVVGFWRPLPAPGLRMAADNCAGRDYPRIVQYPTVADLGCLYPGQRVAAGLLLLSPQAAGGYERNWNLGVEAPPEKHYGYALQWAAFTATLLFLFIKLNLKRRHGHD